MTPTQLISLLSRGGEWEDQFNIDADNLERKSGDLPIKCADASGCFAEIAHEIIDLFVQVVHNPTSAAPSTNASPSTPSSPLRHPPHPSQSHTQHQHAVHHPTTSLPFKPDQLMHLKIIMRDREAGRPPRPPLKTFRSGYSTTGSAQKPHSNQTLGYGQGSGHPNEGPGGDPGLNEGLGRNEGTVRFLFGAD